MILNRPYQNRLAPRGVQDRLDQKRSGAFSIGAGDSGVGDALGRAFIEIGTQSRQGAASVDNLGPGNSGTRSLGGGIRNDCCRSGGDGLVDEAIAVTGLALHRDKNVAWPQSAGIILHTGDRRIAALREHFRALEQLLEGHWSDSIARFRLRKLCSERTGARNLFKLSSERSKG